LIYRSSLDDIGDMKTKAVPQAGPNRRFGLLSLCLPLALVGLISVVFAGSAIAAPVVAKDGKVSACYRVKGKAKGAMRVVPVNKKCRKGERKLAWSVTGPAGQNGARGPAGDNGSNGATGPSGPAGAAATPNEAALQAKIASLTVKIEGLEGILAGVTNGELTGTIAKLTGITGLELGETVGALPVVDSLCSQASTLTSQANLLRSVIGGLGLSPALEVIGLLQIPALPAVLTAYTCPAG
jgi:hypothetical protein